MPLPAGSPAPPALRALLPAPAHVLEESWVRLHGDVPQVVVVDEQLSGSLSGESTDLVLYDWRRSLARWVAVFDAAKTPVPGSAGSTGDPALPPGAAVSNLEYATLTATPGRTDLAFWADVSFGANAPFDDYIVHDDGRSVTIAYAASAESATARVLGTAPHQKLSMTAAWIDPIDPECCPVRRFTRVVGWVPAPASTPARPPGYRVLTDTRSWMGVYLATVAGLSAGGSPPPAVVLSVVPGSPASGVLEQGDRILSVTGRPPPPPSSTSLLGPAVVDEVDAKLPGAPVTLRVARDGEDVTVELTLSSYANPANERASPPVPGYFGAGVAAGSRASAPGAVVTTVQAGSAAARAGLVSGDVVTAIGTVHVSTGGQLEDALLATKAGTVAKVAYATTSGQSRTATLHFTRYPATTATSGVVPPLVDEL